MPFCPSVRPGVTRRGVKDGAPFPATRPAYVASAADPHVEKGVRSENCKRQSPTKQSAPILGAWQWPDAAHPSQQLLCFQRPLLGTGSAQQQGDVAQFAAGVGALFAIPVHAGVREGRQGLPLAWVVVGRTLETEQIHHQGARHPQGYRTHRQTADDAHLLLKRPNLQQSDFLRLADLLFLLTGRRDKKVYICL